ncbi:hypothetical protein GGQ80_001803 [Sphingomonas jinjuensis]|uniref:Uncharacterized protein n=1 Tax=Sphingomonas jinjuensis TaxID=535907 RepID=A0A840FE71_9SPHN|nr:hypothetical protein [Sphingomonas jinjuensis]
MDRGERRNGEDKYLCKKDKPSIGQLRIDGGNEREKSNGN